ncbi:COMM domain-containing protein 3-like [Leptopilina heterotoma]|uniref:COMM domain-containing protein 3-like n=1 Tax=Leptopilina heterotoma TaxID=63436 RepID=UPI001CA84850|nr:COMM domain-containing protein 3-like [Leptopilina heterotoma]
MTENVIYNFVNNHGINLLNNETFDQVLEFAVLQICEETTEKSLSQIYGSKPDAVKSAYSGLTSLFVEAGRQHFDKEKLSATLKDSQLNAQQINKICEAYDVNREQFQRKLQVIGGGLPHLVDVNWKLDYCIKSNATDTNGTPIYLISLQTIKHGEAKYLKFTCTLQQLQDLLHKLKDAMRHMEKLST